MNPRRFLPTLAVLVLCLPAAARAEDVNTILRRAPADEAPAAEVILGPTRAQGDFAEHLDGILAAAGETTAAAVDSTAWAESILARHPSSAPAIRQPSVVAPVLAGAAGGALGLYGGAVAGLLATGNEGEWNFGLIVGAFVGETLLLPIGVHLGNGSRGSFLGDLGLSILTGLAGAGVAGLAGTAGFAIGAAGQLAAVVANERATARRHLAEEAAGRRP